MTSDMIRLQLHNFSLLRYHFITTAQVPARDLHRDERKRLQQSCFVGPSQGRQSGVGAPTRRFTGVNNSSEAPQEQVIPCGVVYVPGMAFLHARLQAALAALCLMPLVARLTDMNACNVTMPSMGSGRGVQTGHQVVGCERPEPPPLWQPAAQGTAAMFKNSYQAGFLSILYSIGSKPLLIWDKQGAPAPCGQAWYRRCHCFRRVWPPWSFCPCYIGPALWSRRCLPLAHSLLITATNPCTPRVTHTSNHHAVRNGHIKRITDADIESSVLEIMSSNVSTTYITCPADPAATLGIKLPFLVRRHDWKAVHCWDQ